MNDEEPRRAPSAIAKDYQARLAERTASAESAARAEFWISVSRLVVFVAGLVAAWLSLQSGWFSPWWLLLFVALFLVLVTVHERALRRRTRSDRAVSYYEAGLRRLAWDEGTGEWPEVSANGERYRENLHLYADDLDLFGSRSLFERLSVARTRVGQDVLAGWLRAPAEPSEVRARQAAVAEVAKRPDLRERLWVLGGEIEGGMDAKRLIEWSGSQRSLPAWLRWPALALVLANALTLIAWGFFSQGPRPFLYLLVLDAAVFTAVRTRFAAAINGVEKASRDLYLMAELLVSLEGETAESPWMTARISELGRGADAAGRRIQSLRRLVELLDSRRNPFFAPFGALLWWGTHLALSLENWREEVGPRVARWVEIVGELEALSSLAHWRAENEAFSTFPEIAPNDGGVLPSVEGEKLNHPLLSRAASRANDISLGGAEAPQGYIVSGSNMSGKSTYLRTVGLQAVLALAGGAVPAERFRIAPVAIASSIRINDSLAEGASRFYAEIKRLRQVLDATAGERPVLFLLDEILHGTNSHDRRIGAEAFTRSMLDRGAVGLVTTHDLALAAIAEDPDLHLRNVHFDDRVEEGRIVFDYQLRDGVVTRSNALALMREVGLEV